MHAGILQASQLPVQHTFSTHTSLASLRACHLLDNKKTLRVNYITFLSLLQEFSKFVQFIYRSNADVQSDERISVPQIISQLKAHFTLTDTMNKSGRVFSEAHSLFNASLRPIRLCGGMIHPRNSNASEKKSTHFLHAKKGSTTMFSTAENLHFYDTKEKHDRINTHSSSIVNDGKNMKKKAFNDDKKTQNRTRINGKGSSSHHGCQEICQDDYIKYNLPLPPPLPDPKFSFHRRVMPSSLIQFSSPEGRRLFQESLSNGMAEAFFPLSEQFLNQSDPAYCGLTSLIMVLNAIGIDPNVRWKGGWRWYGSEDMILDSCCIIPERVRRAGILLEEFRSLGKCQGLSIDMKRPHPFRNIRDQCIEEADNVASINSEKRDDEYYGLEEFRNNIIHMVRNPPRFDQEHETNDSDGKSGFLVASFSRQALGQTGDGHFSPIAAYSEETDRCLVLDVARFKYPPYWASVKDLYEAMRPIDCMTNKSRGWFLVHPPRNFKGTKTFDEEKRDADLIPLNGEQEKRKEGCRTVSDLNLT